MTEEAKITYWRVTSPWRMAAWSIAALLLLLPLVAMQFTREVAWTASDFVFAAVMIGGTGLLFELAVRRSRNLGYRVGVGVLLAAIFLLIWINGAVGIVGDESHPFNLLYGGVILVAVVGALVSRFRPAGMAYAMIATAGTQTLVGIMAVVVGGNEPPGPVWLAILNGGFVALFLGAAWLFARAAAPRT